MICDVICSFPCITIYSASTARGGGKLAGGATQLKSQTH